MIAVGIDVSKSKSMVAVLDSYGTVLASPYTVNHDAADMNGKRFFWEYILESNSLVFEDAE